MITEASASGTMTYTAKTAIAEYAPRTVWTSLLVTAVMSRAR
jgi:hypothetical protein